MVFVEQYGRVKSDEEWRKRAQSIVAGMGIVIRLRKRSRIFVDSCHPINCVGILNISE